MIKTFTGYDCVDVAAARRRGIVVAKAHEAFKPDGALIDPNQQTGIEGLGKTLASFLMKLKG